jgi:hypothetical protein
MIYIMYVLIFSVGGETPTEVETHEFKTMQECMDSRVKIADDTGAPTETYCEAKKVGNE